MILRKKQIPPLAVPFGRALLAAVAVYDGSGRESDLTAVVRAAEDFVGWEAESHLVAAQEDVASVEDSRLLAAALETNHLLAALLVSSKAIRYVPIPFLGPFLTSI